LRIGCPFCGERDVHEFVSRGEALPPRPDPEAPDAEALFVAYLHDRKNPCGPSREHWYHASGCRRWLVVDRDLSTHEVLATAFADGGGL
jgi:sarcosine oxidase subunit delta